MLNNAWPVEMTWALDRVTRIILLIVTTVFATACGGDDATPTSPTTTATTTATATAAEASIVENFDGTLGVSGSSFYSFTVTQYGTVNVTLTRVSGAGIPSTVWLSLGLGTPSGEDCSMTTTLNTAAGSGAQITGTYNTGVYCARVADIGNLFAPAAFSITIAHP